MVYFNREKCTPEQCRALAVLEQTFPITQNALISTVPALPYICSTGSLFIINHLLKTVDLPRGEAWLWNQSRAKSHTVDSTGTIRLSFNKLNTRKSKAASNPPPAPLLKLWIFDLDFGAGCVCSVLWCERGFQNLSNFNVLEMNKHTPAPEETDMDTDANDLSVNDFQFLRPFVSDSVAISLGWEIEVPSIESLEAIEFDKFITNIFSW